MSEVLVNGIVNAANTLQKNETRVFKTVSVNNSYPLRYEFAKYRKSKYEVYLNGTSQMKYRNVSGLELVEELLNDGFLINRTFKIQTDRGENLIFILSKAI